MALTGDKVLKNGEKLCTSVHTSVHTYLYLPCNGSERQLEGSEGWMESEGVSERSKG